jgi:hypothetical protein
MEFAGELLTKRKRRERRLEAAEAMFAEDLAGRVFGFESDAARALSRIAAHRRAVGRPISHADAQIAAIAKVQGPTWRRATLVTSRSVVLMSLTLGTSREAVNEAKPFLVRSSVISFNSCCGA